MRSFSVLCIRAYNKIFSPVPYGAGLFLFGLIPILATNSHRENMSFEFLVLRKSTKGRLMAESIGLSS